MKSNTKKIVVVSSIIGALVVLTGAIIIRNRRKKLQASIEKGSPEIVQPAKSTTKSIIFPLKRSMGNNTAEKNAIKVVQRYINAKGIIHWWLQILPVEEDGVFGSKTENELKKLAGVSEVSYTLYKEMEAYLYPTPNMLSPNAPAYKATSTDPSVQKNNLFGTSALSLFG